MKYYKTIKNIFEDEDFIKYNKWFFDGKWELNSPSHIKFETGTSYLEMQGGIWLNGIWYGGWFMGAKWKDGVWKNGMWISGYIYNPKTKQYENSSKPPNECKWSLSYGK